MQQLYILSRDFKELGPISYPELLALKPKARDMVWEIGKSNAWKFFSQINPPTEQTEPVEKIATPQPVLQKKTEAPQPKSYQQYLPKTAPKIIPLKEKNERPQTTVSTPKKNIEPKFSKPPEEVKAPKLAPIPAYKESTPKKSRYETFGKAAVAIFVIMLGAGGYLYLSNKKNSIQYPKTYVATDESEFKQELIDRPDDNATHINYVAPDNSEPAEMISEKTTPEAMPEKMPTVEPISQRTTGKPMPETNDHTQINIEQTKPQTYSQPKSQPQPQSESQSQPEPEFRYQSQPPIHSPTTGERIRRTRNEPVEPQSNEPEKQSINEAGITREESPKASTKGNLTIKSNQYQKVAFGGIRNLKLIVTNNSALPIRNVKIELQYLNKNNKLAKTKQFKLKEIAANGEAEIMTTDTNFGSEIKYTIVSSETGD